VPWRCAEPTIGRFEREESDPALGDVRRRARPMRRCCRRSDTARPARGRPSSCEARASCTQPTPPLSLSLSPLFLPEACRSRVCRLPSPLELQTRFNRRRWSPALSRPPRRSPPPPHPSATSRPLRRSGSLARPPRPALALRLRSALGDRAGTWTTCVPWPRTVRAEGLLLTGGAGDLRGLTIGHHPASCDTSLPAASAAFGNMPNSSPFQVRSRVPRT
jgi:hypothetical protein